MIRDFQNLLLFIISTKYWASDIALSIGKIFWKKNLWTLIRSYTFED